MILSQGVCKAPAGCASRLALEAFQCTWNGKGNLGMVGAVVKLETAKITHIRKKYIVHIMYIMAERVMGQLNG